MKTKKLKNLVKKARGELVWTVREEEQTSGPLRIFTDPAAKVHTIFRPLSPPVEGPVQELHYLHELGHALLCERVHPFFSSGFPVSGLVEQQIPAVSPLLNVASDWFVGQWLMEFCHEVAMEELKSEYAATAEMMNKGETPGIDKFFVAVLIAAQSKRYLKAPVECTGFLDTAVQALLAVPPEKPSPEKLLALVNSLLSLVSPFQCRLAKSEGRDLLDFYRVSQP